MSKGNRKGYHSLIFSISCSDGTEHSGVGFTVHHVYIFLKRERDRLRERESTSECRAEGERENPMQTPLLSAEPAMGLDLMTLRS